MLLRLLITSYDGFVPPFPHNPLPRPFLGLPVLQEHSFLIIPDTSHLMHTNRSLKEGVVRDQGESASHAQDLSEKGKAWFEQLDKRRH